MMTLANYIPVAKKLIESMSAKWPGGSEIVCDPVWDFNMIAQALYSAYCDGVNVSNAQRELEDKIKSRRSRQKSENDEYIALFQDQMKPKEGS